MPQDKLYFLLRSRKFWATVVVITIALVGPSAGLGDEAIARITLGVAAYILGTALEDGLSNQTNRNPENPVNPVQPQGGNQ
jgi:hypothetical protein